MTGGVAIDRHPRDRAKPKPNLPIARQFVKRAPLEIEIFGKLRLVLQERKRRDFPSRLQCRRLDRLGLRAPIQRPDQDVR